MIRNRSCRGVRARAVALAGITTLASAGAAFGQAAFPPVTNATSGTGAGSQTPPDPAPFSSDPDSRLARAEAVASVLDAYTGAVRTCDIDTAREAYEDAEAVFYAAEADLQFASPERYLQFARLYMLEQVPSGLGLYGDPPYACEASGQPSPDEPDNTSLAEEQAAMWEEIVAFLAASPQSGPLFEDVAVLRGINRGLRRARTAIDGYPDAFPQTPMTAPDPAGAAAHWAGFAADYPTARELIAFRNPALATEIDRLVAAVSDAFAVNSSPGFPAASAALAALAPRYEVATELVAAAARNTIPSRPTFDPDAVDSLDFLGDIVITFFEIRAHINEGTPEAAAQVKVEYDDWLAYPLQFRTGGPLTPADASMATAVDNFVAAQTPETFRAMYDAVNIAEQIFVGQYWGTPELVEFYGDL